MALTLYVDPVRWRAHQDVVTRQFPGMVPVVRGNGFGFGHEALAEEAMRLKADVIAVGTTYEATRMKDVYSGRVLVLSPYWRGEQAPALPGRVIRSVSCVESLRGLRGARVVVEVVSSMKSPGVSVHDLHLLRSALEDVILEGFAIHLPLNRIGGPDAAGEVMACMEQLRAAGLPLHTMFVSHLEAGELDQVQRQFPHTRIRARIGTQLWLGDQEATQFRASVLEVRPVVKGERFGFLQGKVPSDGCLVVVTGGTSHGVGLEAPKDLHGVVPRAKNVARLGLATANHHLSPFVWAGRRRWFAEPPHLQVSVLFVPQDVPRPKVGSELVARLGHTVTRPDRVVDCSSQAWPATSDHATTVSADFDRACEVV
ncbi:alanine racemase [Streptomyces sp. SID13666]|uniref:alanine racemase n=1 Tax=unclassified Streptomyces TaxID=2593676 RepID=UPI0013C03D66|nr:MULTISPECIES: alanine racemase [unclassified Streptomyces]NEA52960.1 alanine racemase [Streptomyces sp. SID13666]NEA69713.1 alanine racemase [Streptomyces sp. SID13588]